MNVKVYFSNLWLCDLVAQKKRIISVISEIEHRITNEPTSLIGYLLFRLFFTHDLYPVT